MNQYYVVGKNIDYSFSPDIHNYLFNYYEINARYDILKINDIEDLKDKVFAGANITIPFKNDILKLSNENSYIAHEVKKDLSVNTIFNNKFYSTDHYGILKVFEDINVQRFKFIVILGSGATSKIVKSVLLDNNINEEQIINVSRISQKNFYTYENISNLKIDNYLIINCTPMGNNHNNILNENFIKSASCFFDLGYSKLNNDYKKLCLDGNTKYYSGINMLLNQAFKSFELWTSIDIDESIKKKCYEHVLWKNSTKLIVTGMPFSGKTTLYNECEKKGFKGIVDVDIEIEKYTGTTNYDYINKYGIKEFRKIETSIFKKLIRSKNKIIFTGGKTLLIKENYSILSQELIINISESLSVLESRFNNTRANIKNIKELATIYYNRIDRYNNVSHLNYTYLEALEMIYENSNY